MNKKVLTKEEKKWLLQIGSDTETSYPKNLTVSQLYEKMAVKYGDNMAISSLEGRLSYAELNAQANQLARHLQSLGVKRGDFVGLSCERSLDMIIAILGILKAGAAYLPIDSSYPLERKLFMIDDAKISFLITQQKFKEAFPQDSTHLICLEKGLLERYPANNLNVAYSPLDAAYVYYTSGSTGKPKGVKIPHRGIVRLVRNTHWMSISQNDRFLQLQNISFDGSTFEIWGSLLNGAALIIYPPKKIDLEGLAKHIVENKISVLLLTTRLFNLLVEEQLDSLKSLRMLCTGGEAMSSHHAQIAYQALPSCQIVNVYGPTENTTFTTVYTIKDCKSIAKEVPIGTPVSNTSVYILDENCQLVPKGVVGELCTGGDGLSIGYLNRDELNKEKFIPNPFGEGLLYRTGDLACFREDGQISYCGRVDDQVKIRGFRIELSEIEQTLCKHPEVIDCAVVTRKDHQKHLQILAYIQPRAERDSESFREFLISKLPDYMIPAHIVCLPKLPLTQNGKIDRKALPLIPEMENSNEAFKTSWEQIVASTWSELFGWKNVSPQAHFFKMGGDSLGAMMLVSKLKISLNIEIPIDLLFQYPVLADFAYELEHCQHPSKEPIQPRAIQTPVPFSYNQEALWIEDRLVPESTHYAVPLPFYLKGKVDKQRLEAALNKIVQRHEILRTLYDIKGQHIKENSACLLHWRKADTKEQALKWMQETASKPINLTKGPLIGFYVFQINENEHLALLYAHHIILDDFAIRQFFKELAHFYSIDTALSPLAIQYGDFAVWQRDFLQTESAKKQIEYWKNQLKEAPELLELPWDKTRPSQLSHKGGLCHIELETSLINQLDLLAKNYKVSKFTVLLSIYFVLLNRYSNQDDILVGTPFANRNSQELESLIGFCSQMIVIRASLSQNPSFSSLLEQVNRLIVEAQKNVDIPFEKLVSEINPARNPSFNPLFQVGFGLENLEDLKLHLEGVDIKTLEVKSSDSKFDLYLTVKKSTNGLSCHLEYSSELFEEKTAQQMLNHYQSLMAAVVAQPDQKIGLLPILTEKEEAQIREWNNTFKPYPHQTICQRFEEVAAQYPNSLALRSVHSLSYKTLNETANQLARYLITQGVKKGSCVAVSFDRSPDLIIALLATLKTGAVFVPIDPCYPSERRDYILEDSAIELVLSQNDYKDLFPGKKVCTLETIEPSLDKSNLHISAQPTQASHILYTSGSTGKPKGVKLSHQSVLNLVSGADWFQITPNDTVLHCANISFDVMIVEVFGALLNGGALSIYAQKEISLEALRKQISNEKVTHAIFTPRIFNLLLEDQISALNSLRYLVSVGEAMSVQHAKLALDALPNCKIVNGYGPIEALGTAYTIQSIKSTDLQVPIGKPMANTTAYVLNDCLKITPSGVAGELYIGGDCLALEYQNRSDLTVERFILNPFGHGLLYRTGDLCRFRQDGQLMYIGRKDTQVKIRGFRVELGEIESILRSDPAIRDCAVLVKEDFLVAYVTLEEGYSLCEKSLREYASSKLPSYMIPGSFIVLEGIPLTSNGKVDVKKLPNPKTIRVNKEKNSLNTLMQKSVASLWTQVLKVEDIEADDHFFKLGGSSIHAIHIVSLLKKELGIEVSMNFVFQYPTLRDFAARLSDVSKELKQEQIPKRKLNDPVRVSWNQESFWQIDLMIPNSSNYTMVLCLELEGRVDVLAMEKAINKIISRHEALRTRFEDRGEYRIQVIEEGDLEVFHFADLSHELNPEQKAMDRLDVIFKTPFNLHKLPLIEVHLLQVGKEKFIGALYVHHIIFDGWSVGAFLKEWRQFYKAYLLDRTPEESNPPIHHPDFASWHNEFLKTKAAQKQIAYWKKQIQGVQLINLPCDFPRPERFKGGGGIIQWMLPEKLSADLKKTAQELGVTLYELIITAYKVLLYGYSGQNDLLIGSPFANRNREELKHLLGFFIHMFAIRTQFKGSSSFKTLLRQVSKTMAKAYANSDVPCEAIFAELYPDWNPTFNRFQVGFSLDTVEPTDEDFENLKTTVLPKTNFAGKFDFYLGVMAHPQNIYFYMYYCSDIYLSKRVEDMLSTFQSVLADIVLDPNEKIDNLIKKHMDL